MAPALEEQEIVMGTSAHEDRTWLGSRADFTRRRSLPPPEKSVTYFPEESVGRSRIGAEAERSAITMDGTGAGADG